MKYLGNTKFFLGSQLKHLPSSILIHQTACIQKTSKKFNIEKSYQSNSPMAIWSLGIKKAQFRPRDDGEEIPGPEVPYQGVVGEPMCLTNYIMPNIAFVVNLVARHNATLTKHHWEGVKNIFWYPQSIFFQFQKNLDIDMIGWPMLSTYLTSIMTITNWFCASTWWYRHLMEIFQADSSGYIHKSF